jgi:Heavy metal associated domain 2
VILKLKYQSMASRKLTNSDKNAVVDAQRQQGKNTTKSVASKATPMPNISYSVVHAIPGRIRFRIPRLAKDSEYANKLKQLIESDAKTTNVRINLSAASIVINYQPGVISGDQMRSHLVNLIQTAPNIALPAPVTAKTIARAIFDALINLIDGTRNINKARTAIKHQEVKTDIWERILGSAKTVIQGLKSAILFILPNKQWRSQSSKKKLGLQSLAPPAVGGGKHRLALP